jgi:hypothetical protein
MSVQISQHHRHSNGTGQHRDPAAKVTASQVASTSQQPGEGRHADVNSWAAHLNLTRQ